MAIINNLNISDVENYDGLCGVWAPENLEINGGLSPQTHWHDSIWGGSKPIIPIFGWTAIHSPAILGLSVPRFWRRQLICPDRACVGPFIGMHPYILYFKIWTFYGKIVLSTHKFLFVRRFFVRRFVYGLSTICPRFLYGFYGLSMVCLRFVYGLSRVCLRFFYGCLQFLG